MSFMKTRSQHALVSRASGLTRSYAEGLGLTHLGPLNLRHVFDHAAPQRAHGLVGHGGSCLE